MNLQDRPQSILLISGVQGDTRRYRTLHPYEQLCLAGVEAAVAHISDPHLDQIIDNYPAAIFHRTAFDPKVGRLIQSIQSRRGLALFDTDDLTFDPDAFPHIASPDFADPVRADLYRQMMRRTRQSMDLCQAALVSTGYLAEEVQKTGQPAWIHRNAFSLEMLALSEAAYRQRQSRQQQDGHRGARRTVIGYASGTSTHNRDFALLRLALLCILDRYPQTELWTIGPLELGADRDPKRSFGAFRGRIRSFPRVPWRDLPDLLSHFDINLAPLVMSPFGMSKSEIKYVEAALLRLPTVASPTEAFHCAIRPGENGFLAGDHTGWVAALETLVQDSALRRAMGEKAYVDVLQRYHPAVRSVQLIETLNDIARRQGVDLAWSVRGDLAAASRSWAFLDPRIERHPTLVERGMYELQQHGVQALARQVWIFIRRLLAPIFPFKDRRKAE